MEKKSKRSSASEFNDIAGIEYFKFEEEFIEKNIRCIPMIVRFKMDKVGIKLKLDEWSSFIVEERIELACRSCDNHEEERAYHQYLSDLVKKRSNKKATGLAVEINPGWNNLVSIPAPLSDKLEQDGLSITMQQWAGLTNLQRFALLKLCRPGHESKNFKKALREFRLTPGKTTSGFETKKNEVINYY
jgi:hypothetical protein